MLSISTKGRYVTIVILELSLYYFNGYILEKGKKHGIATPINQKIVEMIKEIEKGERKIEPHNISLLLVELQT